MAYIGKRPQDTFPANNAVTSSIISENAVGSSEIATNAVTTTQIADNAVTGVKIAENGITSRELAANTIATGNIADNAIDSTKIAQNSILTKHIDDGQITTDQILDGTIATGDLADDAVTTAKITDANVTTAKIADSNVTTAKIADDAVTTAKMASLARGAILVGDSSGNPSALALGSNGLVLKSDGSDLVFAADAGKSTEEIQDIAGGMFTGNTETGITATYQDADGTIDLVVGTLNQDTTGNAATATALETGRTVGMTGDVVWTSASFDGSGNVTGAATIQANAVESAMIAENNITSRELAANTIATGNIADNAVDGTKIASNSILTRHIDDDQITGDQLADAIEVVTSVGVGGGSTNGVVIEQGAIKIKNGGTQSYVDLYCESSNAHYLRLQAPAHSAFSGNPTVTLPSSAGTIALTTDVQTTEELQDLVGAMFSSNTETGITATYQDSDGTIDLVVGTLNQNTTGTAATVTTAAQPNITSVGTLTGLTVSGNTTVGGNLTVNGTTTTLNTTNSVISDRLIELGNGTSGSPANDMGIVMERGDSANAFMGFDESTDKFIVGTGTFTGASTGDLTITTGTLVANVEGNLTGTASAIADNCVTSAKIVNGTIASADIANNAILTQHIDDNQITTDQIADNTIATANIADNAVDSTKIAQNSILTKHIDDAQVTTDQLGADAVTAAKLADDAVVTANIVDANVTTAKIADNAITAAKLSIAGNGTSGQAILSDGDGTFSYGSSGKTTEEIQDIVGAMVSSNTETNISVTYQDADGTIDFVVPNTLTSVTELGTLTTLTVDDIKINGTQIGHTSDEDAMSIASNGIVTFTQIPVLPNDSITQAFIADDAVGADQLAASAVVTASIVDDNVTQAKIADDAVGADQLAANSVVSASIVNGSIVSADIAANTIATSNVADNAIDSTKIASNSILTRHIDDNQITGDQIADDLVLSGTGALRVPDGTTGQRPGSPAAGMFRYNTTDSKFEGYTDSWGEIGGGGGSNGFLTDIFDGSTTPATDGSRVAFTLSQSVSDEKFLMVFIDGVYQAHSAYSVSGSTLTMADAPVAGRELTVHSISAAISGDGLTVNNFSGDGSDTTFTLSINPNHENNTQVYIDGVYQFKNTYAVSGTTLTFSSAPPNGSSIEVMIHGQTAINTFPATGISGLTEVTAVGADHFMIFDATDSALKKSLVSDVIEQAAGISSSADATFLTADSSENAVFTGTVTANAGVVVDNITIDGTEIDLSSGSLTLDIASETIIDSGSSGILRLKHAGTDYGMLFHDSNHMYMQSNISDGDMIFRGNDGGSTIAALTLDMSDAGSATFNHDVTCSDITATGIITNGARNLIQRANDDSSVTFANNASGTPSGHAWAIGLDYSASNGLAIAYANNGIPSLTGNNLIQIDTSGKVGIGTTSPTEKLTVNGAIALTGALADDRTSTGAMDFSSGVTRLVSYGASGTAGIHSFRCASGGAASAEFMRIQGTGEVHITSSGDAISPSIKHGGATGDNAKLRLINRSGQGANKGGILELGAVTDDGVTRSDVFASLHGGKDNATSGNKAGYLDFATSNGASLDQRMRLTSNGELLMGDTSLRGSVQRGQIQVTQIDSNNAAGISAISGNDEIAGTFCLYSSGTASAMISVDPDQNRASSNFYIHIDGAQKAILDSSGNFTITGSYGSSDRALKENIVTLPNQLEKVKQLNPVSFDWKEKAEDGSTESSIGFVAQEVEALYPNLIRTAAEDTDAEEASTTQYKSLNYAVMVSILTKAVQELSAELDAAKARITTLEG